MKVKKFINIGKDFSDVPMGRFVGDSDFSGEKFRDEILAPALADKDNVVEVNIDETEGYGSSFLEEAFGGLVRKKAFKVDDLHQRLRIKCNRVGYSMYKRAIWHHIDAAGKQQ